MSRLTVLPKLPRPDSLRVGPHAYRRLAGRVLITNEWGGRAFLSEPQYRRFLEGLDEADPLWEELKSKGFIRHRLDIGAASRELFRRSEASWRAPSTHIFHLEREARLMSLETLRRCVDFAFTAPGPQVSLELVAADAEAVWPAVWFCVQYARRRGEWAKRPLFLTLRAGGELSAARVEFLRGHGVARRLVLELAGGPGGGAAGASEARRALCIVGPASKDPVGWADWLSARGLDSVRLQPERALLTARGVAFFLAFYAAFIERLAGRAAGQGLVEEGARAFLSRLSWDLPGVDIFQELAYSPDGGVHTSSQGLELAETRWPAFRLGEAGRLRYEDISGMEVARACLMAALSDNQPMCSQCVYKTYCALPPSGNMALQGSVWGDMASSPLCALHMGQLDYLFGSLDREPFAGLMSRWGVAETQQFG